MSAIFLLLLADLIVRSVTGHGLAPRDGTLDVPLWVVILTAAALDVSRVIAWITRK